MSIFDQVYISAQREFFADFPSLPFADMIDELAIKKQYDEQGNSLVINDEQVCRGRAKRYLLRRVNKFVSDLDIVDADVDMKECVSMTQLNRLIRVYKMKRGRITSYAMIILHVLLLELRNADPSFNDADVLKFAVSVEKIAELFFLQYPDNELARFLVQSGNILIEEIEQNRKAAKDEFPGIPRRGALEETT